MPRNAVSAIELEDPLGNIVEEVAIVRYRDHCARIFLKIALEPSDRFCIQMIGRFIKEQHVRSGQQQTTQCDAALLAPREGGDLRLPWR